MAFHDSRHLLYDGKILIDYKDKAHRYYKRERVTFELPADNAKAWGPATRPKGTTTLLADTLEKKGLMTWPLGLALKELFGFYDFVNENNEQMLGFSPKNGGGTAWKLLGSTVKEAWLPIVQSASKAWQRKQKQGADIGSLVHDAIEQYILGTPFELTLEKYEEGQLWWTGVPNTVSSEQDHTDREEWLKTAPAELEMAKLAYGQFLAWWAATQPKLLEAENIVYSLKDDYCGSYDARLAIKPEHHPVYKDWDRDIIVMTDWKTSKASIPAGAPMGIYYSYFIQDAAYAAALEEMTGELVDDLLVVSARKDGSFDHIYASELGLSVQDCIDWWRAVVLCYRNMEKTKAGLVALAAKKEATNVQG